MKTTITKRLSTRFLGLVLKNPIVASAGTCGYGEDFFSKKTLSIIGGIAHKSITLLPKKGNPSPRICETEAGFINSVGLQNVGLKAFLKDVYPRFEKLECAIFANIAGEKISDYETLVENMARLKKISAVELNVSCPNVSTIKAAGRKQSFSSNQKSLFNLLKACRKKTKKPIIVKLAPNHESIVDFALMCEKVGVDGLSIANTFFGMKINIHTRFPMIKNIFGGYSGMAVKPMVLKMVYDVHQAVNLPIMAIGGVCNGEDVVEYLLAGASVVGVGTSNLIDPNACTRIVSAYKKYLLKHKTSSQCLVGAMNC